MDNLIKEINRVKNILKENKFIENIIPKKINKTDNYFDNIKDNIQEIDYIFTDIMNDILNRKSKMLRPFVLYKVAEFYKMDLNRIMPVLGLIEILHNSSLIIDDIEDDSEYRRNLPCIHKIYGVDLSINAGCLGYFIINNVVNQIKNIKSDEIVKIYNIYFEGLKSMHIGQGLDIYYHKTETIDQNKFLDKKWYSKIVQEKTCRLILIGIDILNVLYPISNLIQLKEFLTNLMYVFQVKDDLKNLIESAVSKSKNLLGEDILEGKQTLIFIEFINSSNKEDLQEFLKIFKKDKSKIPRAIELLNKYKCIEIVDNTIKMQVKEMVNSLDKLFNGDYINIFIELINYIVN